MLNQRSPDDDEARLSDNARRGYLHDELHCPVEGAALATALALDGQGVHQSGTQRSTQNLTLTQEDNAPVRPQDAVQAENM